MFCRTQVLVSPIHGVAVSTPDELPDNPALFEGRGLRIAGRPESGEGKAEHSGVYMAVKGDNLRAGGKNNQSPQDY